MASFKRAKTGWRAYINKPGRRKCRTFSTKAEAKAWATKEEAELEAARTDKTSTDLFSTAIDRYIKEVVPQHKGARWERIRLLRIDRELGGKTLRELVNTDTLAVWKYERSLKVSAGSVRREMNLLNQVLQTCWREWQLIPSNPLSRVKKPPIPKPRDRLISDEEISAVVAKLGYKDYVAVTTKSQQTALAFLIALETAMRMGEILKIPPGYKGKVFRLEETKNEDARAVPLSVRARELVARIPKTGWTLGSSEMSVLFGRARAACGYPNSKEGGFRFHDSRANALTMLSRTVDVLTLARVVGHRDTRSLMIYYRESMEDIADRL